MSSLLTTSTPGSSSSSSAPPPPPPPSLRVPVEVLERILKYAFVTPNLIVPSSPLPSNKGKLSILLVSHAIHDLVLPLLFDTLTLAKPSDFRLFFHSTEGLLVGSGPIQTKRRQAIKRIIVTPEARIPLNEPEEFASQGEGSLHDADFLVSLNFEGLEGVEELVFSEVRGTEVMTTLHSASFGGDFYHFDTGMVRMLEAMKKEGGPFHDEALEDIGELEEMYGLVGGISKNRRVEAHYNFFHSVVGGGGEGGTNVVVKLALSNWSQQLQGEDTEAEVEAPSLPREVEIHATTGVEVDSRDMEDFVAHVELCGLEGTGVRLVGFEGEDMKLFGLTFEQGGFALAKDGMWRAKSEEEEEEGA